MTILFIDDDPDDTDLYCEVVAYLNSPELIYSSNQSIDCMAVNNGRKALDLLSALKKLPDYIFLDINMPVMVGKECLRLLKANPSLSKIPVVMLSTSFSENESCELRTLGASDCILKPSGFNGLVGILSRYVYNNVYANG